MNHGDLSGVLVKIDRAKVHLDDFDDRVEPIEEACREAIVRERDEQRSEYVFRFDRVPAVPPDLSAILGDAIHNLRVSLDHLAWQLVKATGGIPTGGTSFPVLKRPPRAIAGVIPLPQITPGVSQGIREALDAVQPYRRDRPAHHDLAVLHGLDISDKHHQLLVAVVGIQNLSWRGEVEPTTFRPGPYRDGDEVCRFAYSDTHSKNEFSPVFGFTLRLTEPAAGPWRASMGAGPLVRRSLHYIEEEVLPRFRASCKSSTVKGWLPHSSLIGWKGRSAGTDVEGGTA